MRLPGCAPDAASFVNGAVLAVDGGSTTRLYERLINSMTYMFPGIKRYSLSCE